jgi:hypothetical protein
MITDAAPVTLQAGDTVSNIVITALRKSTYSIRGRVEGVDGFAEGAVMSISSSDEEQTVIVAGGGNLREDNTFAFDDISPGTYIITYLDPAPTFLQTTVTVVESDVDDLVLRPSPNLQMKGRIVMEKRQGDHTQVKVSLRPATDGVVSPIWIATVNNAGLLSWDKPIPLGVYRIRVDAPAGLYVKRIVHGNTDATDSLIDLSASRGDIVVVIGGEREKWR